MIHPAPQPCPKFITIFKTQVRRRQTMAIGDNILTPVIGIGQDIATCAGQLEGFRPRLEEAKAEKEKEGAEGAADQPDAKAAE